MILQRLNWRILLAFLAIGIVSGTIIYSKYLARKIAKEEREKVEEWVEAGKFLISSPSDADTKMVSMILTQNKSIPIIATNEKDSITGFINLDSNKVSKNHLFLFNKLKEFKSQNKPIVWTNSTDPAQRNLYYYGESALLKEVRYYPIVQLLIVGLFIIVTLLALRGSYRSAQNQVWVGMAKETAHQLGTPISSLQGWIEMLKEDDRNEALAHELQKDIDRLKLVSDRFGKIGSAPQLVKSNLITQIEHVVEYIRKRAAGKVSFSIDSHGLASIPANISETLFDWVIENLLKNALDAMEGKGEITIDIKENSEEIFIDIKDTGKGISPAHTHQVFKPGFTTKKRGWGLGLSLSKRIIEQYHKGELFVKQSELGKGTTFRIVLKK
jgi:signal transduction histidine kinase